MLNNILIHWLHLLFIKKKLLGLGQVNSKSGPNAHGYWQSIVFIMIANKKYNQIEIQWLLLWQLQWSTADGKL